MIVCDGVLYCVLCVCGLQEFKDKQRQLKRRALGMEAQSLDIRENDELFSLKNIKDMDELEEIFDVSAALVRVLVL